LRGSEAKPFGFESSDLHASKEDSVEPHFLPLPILKSSNFHPFAPLGTVGIVSASASIFFTFVGFDAVATAAEEKKQPQRNVPPGLFGALASVILVYVPVAIGVTGAYGAQPLSGKHGEHLLPGSSTLGVACQSIVTSGAPLPVVCSNEALAFVLRQTGHPVFSNLLGFVALITLPSVILMMIYGPTRVFFVMASDSLLPAALGMWQEDIAANLDSVNASELAAKEHLDGVAHEMHAYEFLLYAYLQDGDDAHARKIYEDTNPMIQHLAAIPGIQNDGMYMYTSYIQVEFTSI
jgi:hypothetical protein